MTPQPAVRVECDKVVGNTARIVVAESGEDISDCVTGVDIAMRVGKVTRITLHTRGTLDVLGEVEQVVIRRAPWWHYVISGFGAAALIELVKVIV